MESTQSMMDVTSAQNSPMVSPLGIQPYNVMDSVVRQYSGITSSGYHDQALKMAEER